MANKSDKKNLDNRSKQLNPQSEEFFKSRLLSLTEDDVKTIQKAEVKSKGKQEKGGLGAQAQRHLEKQKK